MMKIKYEIRNDVDVEDIDSDQAEGSMDKSLEDSADSILADNGSVDDQVQG